MLLGRACPDAGPREASWGGLAPRPTPLAVPLAHSGCGGDTGRDAWLSIRSPAGVPPSFPPLTVSKLRFMTWPVTALG